MKVNGVTGVYLLHFEPRYKHAGHYLGWAEDIGKRVYEHENGQSGAKLPMAASKAGVQMRIARIWPGGTPMLEKHLKGGRNNQRRGSLARKCPICKGESICETTAFKSDLELLTDQL